MTSSQVTTLLVDVAVIVLLARALGALASRFDQPPVIGEVFAGILVGPSLFHGAISDTLFPTDVRPFLTALANIGVAVFMFIVGLELDRALLRGRGRLAATVSIGSILLPFGFGTALALYLATTHNPTHRLGFVLFMGAAVSVTAFPVLARILTDRRMQHTRLGGLALTCAAVDDVLAWSLLAIVVTITGSGDDQWRMLLMLPYLALMLLVVRPLLRRVGEAYLRAGALTPGTIGVVLAGLLLSASVTEWIGLHFIFGAFLFGVLMPRDGTARLRDELLEKVGQVSTVLLLPVFFVIAGLKVDLSAVGLGGLGELCLILLAAIGGKFVGAFAGARLNRLPVREAAALATLMNTRGLTELIILSVGLQLGVLDGALYSLMVVMAVVTTAMAGPLLRMIYPRRYVQRDREEAVLRGGVVSKA
ncbi:cation:proton antiporter [Protofrankia coriariae]|uniref:Sodium:proton exchanger n=1 Tax=Protofrankia coriariae TaxID=1562887 RepID=A0ABR5F641_9ACTN|nr:cation:proton antiporter [Protofrankia coriariae]KLL12194.1 sodium:proton exchanger [Protofrankia coriariae]